MLEELKQTVYEANLDLVKHGLVIFTWAMSAPSTGKKAVWLLNPPAFHTTG